jgi:hypothetical protein
MLTDSVTPPTLTTHEHYIWSETSTHGEQCLFCLNTTVGRHHTNRKLEIEIGIGLSKMLLMEHGKVQLRSQTGDIIHIPSIKAVMAVSKNGRL